MTYPPGGYPPPPPQGRSTDRKLLVVIAIFCAITALGVVIGLAIWGYSWFQAQRATDQLIESMTERDDDLTGTWTGTFTYPSGQTADMTFVITSSDPIDGKITYHRGPCVVDVEQQGPSTSTRTLVTSATDGPDACADAGRWGISVSAVNITGTLKWSSISSLIGSRMSLERQ